MPVGVSSELSSTQKQTARERAAQGSADEQTLVELELQVTEALRIMGAYQISPGERIRVFDQFREENLEVFQEIRDLRKRLGTQRAADSSASAVVSPRNWPPAQKRILDAQTAVLQEMAARRAALDQLTAEARIASMDQDKQFFRDGLNTLRELRKQLILLEQ